MREFESAILGHIYPNNEYQVVNEQQPYIEDRIGNKILLSDERLKKDVITYIIMNQNGKLPKFAGEQKQVFHSRLFEGKEGKYHDLVFDFYINPWYIVRAILRKKSKNSKLGQKYAEKHIHMLTDSTYIECFTEQDILCILLCYSKGNIVYLPRKLERAIRASKRPLYTVFDNYIKSNKGDENILKENLITENVSKTLDSLDASAIILERYNTINNYRISNTVTKLLSKNDLTKNQLKILLYLDLQGADSSSYIESSLNIDHSNCNKAINQMANGIIIESETFKIIKKYQLEKKASFCTIDYGELNRYLSFKGN